MNSTSSGKFLTCFAISSPVLILGGGSTEPSFKLSIKRAFNSSHRSILSLEFSTIFSANFRIFFITLVGMTGCE
jgi:hypothetical protein